MTSRSPSIGFRAVLALGLMIGFYGLALGLAGALLWVPYAVYMYAHRIPGKLALGCLAGAAIILWSISSAARGDGLRMAGTSPASASKRTRARSLSGNFFAESIPSSGSAGSIAS